MSPINYTYAGASAAFVAVLQVAEREGITLTRMKVAKLLYLADLRAREDDCAGSSGVSWIWYNYGPWATELITIEDALVRDGVAVRVEGENYYGTRQVSVSLREAPQYEIDAIFFDIVAGIVREYGRLAPSSLRDLTYATAPMIEAQRGSRGSRLDLDGKRAVKPIAGAMKRLARRKTDRMPLGEVSEEIREGLLAEKEAWNSTLASANTHIL